MPDLTPQLNAALESRYRIERELGQGGMATVYLADDIKHERKVALKVLKPELAAVVGAERFLAEIKTTANLQHPHILPLFDSGEADTFLFYVMPYVEGETLADRLARERQLPVADAVQITKDVAEALAYAHGQGVIHRDIKPANILVHSGRPVIADFGIALALGVAGGGRLTETGLSLGTPHYMSPEQATGASHIGPATDIYALGCVLHEMLVGEPPYTGSTPQAVLGKIITEPPTPVTRHRPTVPANVEAAVNKALEKVPADRFRGAADLATALGDPGFRHGKAVAAGVAAGAGPWKRVAMAMTVTTALFAIALGWLLLRPEPPAQVFRFGDPFDEGQELTGLQSQFTSDGSALVYQGPGPTGEGGQLWIRRWADLNATPIQGTEGALRFALSPDDQELAFMVRSGSLSIVGIEGGPARPVFNPAINDSVPQIGGLDWSSDGMLYFSLGAPATSEIQRVPVTGGREPEPWTTQGSPIIHALPDGRGLLIVSRRSGTGQIAVVGPEGGEAHELFPGLKAAYSPTGHIIYSTLEGTLMAAPFDLKSLEETGRSVTLVDDMGEFPGFLQWALSQTGALLYTTGVRARPQELEFVWVTRSGEATAAAPGYAFLAPGRFPRRPTLRLSPDGSQVTFTTVEAGNSDVWVMSFDDGVPRPLTFGDGFDQDPIWFPEDQRIAFVSGSASGPNALDEDGERSDFQVLALNADGTGGAEPLIGGRFLARDVTPDGETLILYRGARPEENPGQRDIFTFRPGQDSEPFPLLANEVFEELSPALSPDGRWIAYVTNEPGTRQVFVKPFPNVEGGRWQVSRGGGVAPVWGHNGRELFYVEPSERVMMSAEFTTEGSAFQVGPRTSLFTLGDEYDFNFLDHFYDVGPDDQRFLFTRVAGFDEVNVGRRFILVQNFFEELKRLVPN